MVASILNGGVPQITTFTLMELPKLDSGSKVKLKISGSFIAKQFGHFFTSNSFKTEMINPNTICQCSHSNEINCYRQRRSK